MSQKLNSPDYFGSYESLQQHFRAQLEGLSSVEKGDKFSHFVQRLLPQTSIGTDYQPAVLSEKKSGDEGVDLIAHSKNENAILYIQSKLWVDRAEAIDSIISKFQAYTTKSEGQSIMELMELEKPKAHFLLVTLSPLAGILERYEKTRLASQEFYRRCKSESRINFIDGYDILQTLKTAYAKINRLPSNLELNFHSLCEPVGNVYIGVMSSSEIKSLYKLFGDALFFENVRDFLGYPKPVGRIGRTSPNNEIAKTITNEPGKLLSRNNGLVFGADKVEKGEKPKQLILTNGSVVNGCQTTMCIVDAPDNPGYILVKVVETGDGWDITKAANYQNAVPDIDLELARYLRPQLVKRNAANLAVRVDDGQKSAFQIVDEIYNRKVAYNETRLLYIGIFSRSPNNVFASNYTELLDELIAKLYGNPSFEESIFETLFELQDASQKGLQESKRTFSNPTYAQNFERFYKDDSLAYRCYVSILALCGAVNVNIAERDVNLDKELERTESFIEKAKTVLVNEPDKFIKFYKLAVKIWMQDQLGDESDAEVRRDMYIRTKAANFTNMFRKLCMEGDLEASRG